MGDWSGKGKWRPRRKQKDKNEGRKIPILADVGPTVNIFP